MVLKYCLGTWFSYFGDNYYVSADLCNETLNFGAQLYAFSQCSNGQAVFSSELATSTSGCANSNAKIRWAACQQSYLNGTNYIFVQTANKPGRFVLNVAGSALNPHSGTCSDATRISQLPYVYTGNTGCQLYSSHYCVLELYSSWRYLPGISTYFIGVSHIVNQVCISSLPVQRRTS